MSAKTPRGNWNRGFVSLTIFVSVTITTLLIVGMNVSKPPPMTAGSSKVSFSFTMQGKEGMGSFPESAVELILHANNPADNSLKATVNTTSITTGTSQVDSTLAGRDWFDVKNFPLATFTSHKIEAVGKNRFSVNGTLLIKDIANDLTFMFNLVDNDGKQSATGNFTIDRLDFGLGASSQPDEENVGFLVTVHFKFEVQQ